MSSKRSSLSAISVDGVLIGRSSVNSPDLRSSSKASVENRSPGKNGADLKSPGKISADGRSPGKSSANGTEGRSGGFTFGKARSSVRSSLLRRSTSQQNSEGPSSSSGPGPLGRWLRDRLSSRSPQAPPPPGPERSNPVYHSEGKGLRRRSRKDKRRHSFNEREDSADGKPATAPPPAVTTNGHASPEVPASSRTSLPMSRSTPNLQPGAVLSFLQQQQAVQQTPPSRSESTASLPASSSSGLSSWGSTQDASRAGWDQAPTPPVRDASSLKAVRYGPGHEKFPSWPVPAAADTLPAVRECCHATGGSHRSKSWTEHTDYPKESPAHYYARPYMRRQASAFTLKTVLERSEAAMLLADPPPPRRRALATLDREGKPPGDLRYLAPSPPERDGPGMKAEPQVPHLTQAEVEEYARTYDAALLRQQSSEMLAAPLHSSQLSHASQGSYAHSEGYHSYVSSTDSTTTPFLDRLRQDSAGVHPSWEEDAERDAGPEIGKWRGSLSDMSVSSGHPGQLIAHSSRVQTPQRHMSESVLYLAPTQQPGGVSWPSRVSRNNAINSRNQAARSPPPQGLSVAERVHELERQSLSVSTSSLASSRCSSRSTDASALRAFQKRALLSYYERQHSRQDGEGQWRSEPHLSPPPAPPRTSASETWRTRAEPQQMAAPVSHDVSDKLLPSDFECRTSTNVSPTHSEGGKSSLHIREYVQPSHVRQSSLTEHRHVRESSITEHKHVRESSITEHKHVRELSIPDKHIMRESDIKHTNIPDIINNHTRGPSIEYKHSTDIKHSRDPSLDYKHIRESSIDYKHVRESSIDYKHVREPSIDYKHSDSKHSMELKLPREPSQRLSHSSNSSLSSSDLPCSPQRKSRHHSKNIPSPTDTSSDLLGPLIVGPSISLDHWVPERPPKKPHLRSASMQQPRRHCAPMLPPMRRGSSPDPPPPTPPPVMEDEVFCDLPLPPPPPELELDWACIGGQTKSNVPAASSYLRRNADPPVSLEGSYKRTTEPVDVRRTETVAPPVTSVTTKTSKSSDSSYRPDPKLTHNNFSNNNNVINNCDFNRKVTSPPDSLVKSYVDLNCVATKLSAFEIKEAVTSHLISSNHKPALVSRDSSSNLIDSTSPPSFFIGSREVSPQMIGSARNSPPTNGLSKSRESPPANGSPKSRSSPPSNYLNGSVKSRDSPPSTLNGSIHSHDSSLGSGSQDVSSKSIGSSMSHESLSSLLIGSSQDVPPTKKASVGSQATTEWFTPVLRLESPTSSSSSPSPSPPPPSSPSVTSCAVSSPPLQRSELVIRVNATSDAASQTEDKTARDITQSSDSPLPSAPCEAAPSPPPASPPASPPAVPQTSRAALREEEECAQLSRDLASQLPPSDRLHTILAPVSEHKKVTDYVSGLFRLDIRSSRPSSRLANQSPAPGSCDQTSTNQESASESTNHMSPPPSPGRVNGIPAPSNEASSGGEPLPADSAYFTTSEPKAMFLTRYSDHISAPEVSASEDLQRKKAELVSRLDAKLGVLRSEQLVVAEEASHNEELGGQLLARLRETDKTTEANKLALHVEEVGKVTSLLLGLSGRLARAENAIMGLSLCDEKRILEGKRDRLAEQLAEAGQLKASIDRRSCAVSTLLSKSLDAEAAADFEHFVHMKASLQVEARELADRVRLGEEQLTALRETLDS